MKNQSLFMFLGGIAVGAAVALLFAPEKGSDTRKKIKKMIDSELDKIGGKCCCDKAETELQQED